MYVHVNYAEAFVHVKVVCSFMFVHVVHSSCSRLLPHHAMQNCTAAWCTATGMHIVQYCNSTRIYGHTLNRHQASRWIWRPCGTNSGSPQLAMTPVIWTTTSSCHIWARLARHHLGWSSISWLPFLGTSRIEAVSICLSCPTYTKVGHTKAHLPKAKCIAPVYKPSNNPIKVTLGVKGGQ